MTGAVLIGLGLGAGLCLVLSVVAPAPTPLARALADLHRLSIGSVDGQADARTPVLVRLLGESWAETELGRRLTTGAATDLRITGTSPARHLAQRAGGVVLVTLSAPVTAALLAAAGRASGVVLPLWFAVLLAPVGFLYPSLALRSKAADRRRTFRHAFSAFLDVVSISLAGGRGVESALHDAADSGSGWAFVEIRRTLLESRLLGETPWAGLGRLGHDLAVPELVELSASASLAGSEGARVRGSLAAKARSLRMRGTAEIEAAAQSASERMSLPVVGLMLGFIVFLTYPAVDQVLNGL